MLRSVPGFPFSGFYIFRFISINFLSRERKDDRNDHLKVRWRWVLKHAMLVFRRAGKKNDKKQGNAKSISNTTAQWKSSSDESFEMRWCDDLGRRRSEEYWWKKKVRRREKRTRMSEIITKDRTEKLTKLEWQLWVKDLVQGDCNQSCKKFFSPRHSTKRSFCIIFWHKSLKLRRHYARSEK
jgi:hypothetical protein